MSILLDENSKIIVQGLTGSEGMKHATKMLASGTNIVGGVNARKAGTTVEITGTNVPVYGAVEEAMKETLASPEGRAAGADIANFATGGVTFLHFDVHEAQ